MVATSQVPAFREPQTRHDAFQIAITRAEAVICARSPIELTKGRLAYRTAEDNVKWR
jgi:hypothetical protein